MPGLLLRCPGGGDRRLDTGNGFRRNEKGCSPSRQINLHPKCPGKHCNLLMYHAGCRSNCVRPNSNSSPACRPSDDFY